MANSDLGAYNVSDIQAIADAIRFKNGSDQLYKAEEMAQAIVDIQAGGYYDAHPYLDGKTHMWIDIPNESRAISLNLNVKRNYYEGEGIWRPTGKIFWGDGTSTNIRSTRNNDQYENEEYTHTYQIGGEYVITIEDMDATFHNYNNIAHLNGKFIYGGSSVDILKAIELNHNPGIGTDGVPSTSYSLFGKIKSLENVIVGPGCSSLGTNVFNGCYNLKNIDLSNVGSALSFNYYYLFNQCYSLKQVDLSNSKIQWYNTTTSGSDDYMFASCYCLESIILPTSGYFATIRTNDFRYMYNLKSITIPENVTELYYNAFNGCYNLHSIYMKSSTPPELGGTLGSDLPAAMKIYVPRESINDYKAATNWSTYSSQFVEYDPQ
jgi:hypothetical protein